MVDFNVFVSLVAFLIASIAAFVHIFDVKIRPKPSFPFGSQHGSHNIEFVSFQRTFLIGYILCLFGDSLQAPYLYFLYQSYGFLESQIAILYVCGLLTNVVFSLAVVYLVQKTERRMLCLIFVGLNSVSCLMKFSDQYGVLLVSRVMDGIASALLTAPFQEWYIHEHIHKHDFPVEWIPLTFRRTAIIHGYSAVFAGIAAELSEATFRVTAFPYLAAIPVLVLGGFWIFRVWSPNRLSSELRPKSFWPQFSRGIKATTKSANMFLLSGIQSLFESCIYMFAFLWTPIFLYIRPIMTDRPSFGYIYSAFMASVLLGMLIQRLLSRNVSAIHLLNGSTALGFVSMSLVVALTYPSNPTLPKFQILLLVFCLYEIAVGIYFPSMQRLQRDLLPNEDRSAILSIFRIPLNIIATIGLLILHSREKVYGNWMILILCMVLLALCFMASLLLQGLVKKGLGGPNVAQIALQLKTMNMDDDDDF